MAFTVRLGRTTTHQGSPAAEHPTPPGGALCVGLRRFGALRGVFLLSGCQLSHRALQSRQQEPSASWWRDHDKFVRRRTVSRPVAACRAGATIRCARLPRRGLLGNSLSPIRILMHHPDNRCLVFGAVVAPGPYTLIPAWILIQLAAIASCCEGSSSRLRLRYPLLLHRHPHRRR